MVSSSGELEAELLRIHKYTPTKLLIIRSVDDHERLILSGDIAGEPLKLNIKYSSFEHLKTSAVYFNHIRASIFKAEQPAPIQWMDK